MVDQSVMQVIKINPDIFGAESDAEDFEDNNEFDWWEEFDKEREEI